MSNKYTLFIWSFIGRFAGLAIYFVTNIALARLLTSEDFGKMAVLSVIFLVANTLADSGLGGALMMESELNKKNCGTVFVFNAIVSLIIFVLIYLFAPFIESFFNVNGLATVARLLGLVFVINVFGIVPKSMLVYNLKFKESSIVSIISVIAASATSIFLASRGFGVYSLVSYQLVSSLLSVLLISIICKYKPYICFDRVCFSRMFTFGVYTTLANILDSFYENIIAVFLGKFSSVSNAGYFSQAKKIEEVSTQSFVQTINNTSFPMLSKKRHDKYEFRVSSEQLQLVVPLLVTPLLIVMCSYSKELVCLFFGEKWLPASSYLQVLSIAGFFIINESINRNFIKSLGEVRKLFVVSLIKRSLAIVILLLAALVSVNCLIYAYVFTSFLGFFINGFLYAKLIEEHFLLLIKRVVLQFIPVIVLWIIVFVVSQSIYSMQLGIIINFLLFSGYYFLVLPKYNIFVLDYLKSFFAKNN